MVNKLAIDGDDTQFEQAFASLVFAKLRGKVPEIFPNLLGFQLVDRTEDGDKAFGVMGFSIGNKIALVPAIFRNGEIKATDMLYLPKDDTFFPLDEAWINALRGRDPNQVGDADKDSMSQFRASHPDLMSFRRETLGKYANDWLKPAVPMLAAFLTKRASFTFRENIDATVNMQKLASDPWTAAIGRFDEIVPLDRIMVDNPRSLQLSYDLSNMYPNVKRAFERFYGSDCFQRWVDEAQNRILEKESSVVDDFDLFDDVTSSFEKDAKPRIYIFEQTMISGYPELDVDDLERLKKETILIKDERSPKNVSTVYSDSMNKQLQTPDAPGIYQVLQWDGKFRRMLVLSATGSDVRGPGYPCSTSTHRVVVDLEDATPKAYVTDAPIFIDGSTPPVSVSEMYDSLPTSRNLSVGSVYVAVTPTLSSTQIFRVLESDGNSHTVECISPGSSFYGSPTRLILNEEGSPGTMIRRFENTLVVPSNVAIIRVEKSYENDRFGNLDDINRLMYEKTASLKLVNDHNDYHLSINGDSRCLTKKGALLSLVGEHGLKEADARAVLRESENGRSVSYRIMHAPGFGEKSAFANIDFTTLDPSGYENYGPRTSARVQDRSEDLQVIDSLRESMSDQSAYDPWERYQAEDFRTTSQQISKAMQTGQREIFDVTALKNMLKTVRPDSLIDVHLDKISAAVDSLARLMLNFYWHSNEFEARYGSQDIPDIEDGLQNSFEALGDIAIYLKNKTIETPYEADEFSLEGVIEN